MITQLLNSVIGTLIVISIILVYGSVSGQVIPSSRTISWEDAGIPGGIPTYPIGTTVTDFGAVGDGATDDTAAIQAAIDACPVGSAVYLPDGAYHLTATLTIAKGVVLRGESRLDTILDLSHTNQGIFIGTYANTSPEYSIVSGYAKGTTSITLSSMHSNFQ